ncbi:MAG: PKD domain-containing protein [Bacteroidota bacterium]
MKKRIHWLLLLGLLIGPLAVQAKHIIGGVLTYECLDNGLYEFTLKMYRDCSDPTAGPFDFGAPMSFYQGDDPFPIETIYISPDVISDLEPEINDPCVVIPPGVCVQEAIYTFQYQFADWPSTETYTVSYQRCCRNNTITNILTPGEIGATFTVDILPAAQEECNSTPEFDNFPPIVICANKPIDFLHSALDTDGDQVIYELCSPLVGGGLGGGNNCNGVIPDPACPPPYDPVQFIPPYTPLNPIGGNPQMTIDPITGQLSGTPNLQGQFVVAVCASEFRNGELMSTIRRDFQFNVASCDPLVSAQVEGDTILADATALIQACSEDPSVSLINTSLLSSSSDEYYWEIQLPDSLLVLEDFEPELTLPGPGLYEGQFIINPGVSCGDTARIQIEIFPEVEAGFSVFYDTCLAGPVFFTDESDVDNSEIVEWSWTFGDQESADAQNPTHIYAEPGEFNVNLIATDTNGCSDALLQNIGYFPAPAFILVAPNATEDCPPAAITFNNLTSPIDTTYQTDWEFGDGQFGTELSPEHIYDRPGTYSVSLHITSPIGCEADTVFENLITIADPPEASFDFEPKSFSSLNPNIQLIDQSLNAVNWNWYINGDLIGTTPEINYNLPDTGAQALTLVITHRFGCLDSLTKFVDVVPETRYFLPNAFTPNNDTSNDFFQGAGVFDGMKNFSMTIWDRWGGLVFETDDPMVGWNGQAFNNGKLLPDGVYVCWVKYTGPRGEPFEIQGYVTLIR